MKLEVGMYVRFDWKKQQIPILIGQITEEHYDELCGCYYSTDVGLVIGEDNLVKEPSFNIIDLIEAGDYVNGCKVHRIANCITIILDNEENISWVKPSEIKSIVTCEQFSSMEYKVGE